MNVALHAEGSSTEALAAALREQLEERWFAEGPRSEVPRSSRPPVESVGEFLGDPLADAWLR